MISKIVTYCSSLFFIRDFGIIFIKAVLIHGKNPADWNSVPSLMLWKIMAIQG